MGEDLFAALRSELPEIACRVYAPVGVHENLLAYLVRRLLENGANSSFVARLGDPHIPASELIVRPQAIIGDRKQARPADLPLPRDIHMPARKLAAGLEFGDRHASDALVAAIAGATPNFDAAPIISGTRRDGDLRKIVSPIDGIAIGSVWKPRPAC